MPVRQWVLTLPDPLRDRCAYDAHLTSQVLRAFLRALFAELRRRARREPGEPATQCGAVTFLQRFGSAMNLNLHFHTLALDGAYLYPPSQPRRGAPDADPTTTGAYNQPGGVAYWRINYGSWPRVPFGRCCT